MRQRVSKGTLVASTNEVRAIKAKRLIVQVMWNFGKGIISEKTIDIRQTINQ